MEIIWFGVFALLLVGYFALEGFDLGVGMLLPVLGRDQEGRDRLVAAMAPFVLANEVWLVAVAGSLFGVFPALEGEVISGLYPLVVSLLVCWILRDAGLWFRRRMDGRGWRAFWDMVICVASLGLALSVGSGLTAALQGLAVSPLSLAGGLVVAAAFAFHGWTFVAWRLPGEFGPGRTGKDLLRSGAVAALPAALAAAVLASGLLGHAAPPATLSVLGLVVLPFAPVMVGAQVWVWRTFGFRREPRNGDGRHARIPSFF
jgi:cytochrome bd-type quinol oxidase subunit 2